MIGLIVILVAGAATFFGFRQTRRFVRNRLRYVDAVHSGKAPFVAGAAATLVAGPVVMVLPWVGAGTALLFGLGVGSGFAAGAKDISRGYKELPRP